jgi:hypothetical protein
MFGLVATKMTSAQIAEAQKLAPLETAGLRMGPGRRRKPLSQAPASVIGLPAGWRRGAPMRQNPVGPGHGP